MSEQPRLVVSLNAVIIAITDEQPRVLTVAVPEGVAIENIGSRDAAAEGRRLAALPSGPLDPAGDRTLELALRRWVRASTGLELGYVEQLYTFGDRFRSPGEAEGVRSPAAAICTTGLRKRSARCGWHKPVLPPRPRHTGVDAGSC